MKKEPELRLYKAHCNSDGCGEGHFDIENGNKWEIERYNKAMNIVERYLSLSRSLQLSGMYDIVDSEKDAKELISIFQKKIKNSDSIIKLLYCAHGRIVFDKKIKFRGKTFDDIDDLIKKIEDFEYIKEHKISHNKLIDAFYQL